jgi:hypothetical protein
MAILTMFGRHLSLLRDSFPDAPAEKPDKAAAEKDSVIAKDTTDSLLNEEAGGENGHSPR